MQLKSGDLLDCCDSYGSWYAGTVVTAREAHNGGKVVRVGFRVYCEDGEKYDSKGKYYGLAETFDEDNIDVTSPRIQKYIFVCNADPAPLPNQGSTFSESITRTTLTILMICSFRALMVNASHIFQDPSLCQCFCSA